MVIGTAGHIDHGKTALVRALTGIDTDRLAEEKRRGITIELGFAHLDLEDGGGRVRCAVVDVPGHERFIRAMVAGATGIDVALVVVAADEGVMPQTREHLDILGLLGVERAVIALSKADLAPAGGDLRALAEADLAEAVRGSALAKARVVPCSARTGEGLDALRAELLRLAREVRGRDPAGLFRLPLDRVFTMKGFGTVVTGTVAGGRARVGDDVVLLPGGRAAKLRRAEVHGVEVSEVTAGQRAALNLAGVARDEVRRGDVLALAGGALAAAQVFDAEVQLLQSCRAPLRSRARVLLHAGTTQVMATVLLAGGRELEPGARGGVQLRLERPMAAVPGDRFILRGFAPQLHHGTTLGGGVIVRVRPPRLRRAGAEAEAVIARFAGAGAQARVALEVRAQGRAGLAAAQLPGRVGAGQAAVTAAVASLVRAGELLVLGELLLHAEAFAALGEAAATAVRAAGEGGLGREELRAKLGVEARVFEAVLTDAARGVLVVDRDRVSLQGAAGPTLTALAARVAETVRAGALQPARPEELAALLKAPEAEVAQALAAAVRAGLLVRVKDLVFARPALDQLRERLRAFLSEHREITPQQWKDLVGATRKYTIPLAEFFDAEKLTLRVGDLRKLRSGAAGAAGAAGQNK
ncbi:MAG: selenocysteine-specific translation elongation factor [Deltaproteobacteria bacterium]|nr:selenocysteine-specific translation elongation factor [Deltaproteobacteria bacterium]